MTIELLKVVKPANPKGWHLIEASAFDPEVHQLWSDGEAVVVAASAPMPVHGSPVPETRRGPGRPRKHPKE